MEAKGVPAVVEMLKKGCLAPEVLTLKKGAAVMFVKNNFDKGYVNGTLGTVSGFDEYGTPIIVGVSGKKFIAEPASWSVEENNKVIAEITQVPLRLAWAITIHKSQGMTLDGAEINLSHAFEKGMGYVALSRVRSLADIQLLGLNEVALQVSPEILAFDRELKYRSEETVKEFRAARLNAQERYPAKRPHAYSVAEMRTSHPAAYQKWSSEEEERMIKGFHAGISIKALASDLGRKYGAIYSRLKKLDLLRNDFRNEI